MPFDIVELYRGSGLCIAHTFIPSWRGVEACTELLAVAYVSSRGPTFSVRHFPYRVKIHPNRRLELINQDYVPVAKSIWDSYNILNSGRVFEMGNGEVSGYNLFPNSGVNDVSKPVRKSVGFKGGFEEGLPKACATDPYSGTLAICAPEVVRILRFD